MTRDRSSSREDANPIATYRELGGSVNRFLGSVLTPWRLKWYSRGAVLAIAVAFLVVVMTGSGNTTLTGRIGGDYRAFYAAGEIVAEGEVENLYSLQTQFDHQRKLLLEPKEFLVFAYPPHFALAYAPLAELPFRVSYIVHTLIMVAALALACVLIQRMYPKLIESPFLLFFLALTAYPILRSVFGGQNTALTILLIVLCWYNVLHNRHYQAGIYLGLLFFKPQFAVPLAGLFFLSGRWRVWMSAGATGIVLFAVNWALLGPDWFVDWIDGARSQFLLDGRISYTAMVSWLGAAHGLFGANPDVANVIGWTLSVLTILAISWVWYRGGQKADFSAQLALAALCLPLISPHTAYYDTGIALIAVVVLLSRLGGLNLGLIVAVWAAGALELLAPIAGFSLSSLPLIVILGIATKHLWSDGSKTAQVAPA